MQVEVRQLDPSTAKDVVVGTIAWTGTRFVVNPANRDEGTQRLLKGIAGEPVRDHESGRMLHPDHDPKEWLAALASNYYSPYLRVTEPK